MFYDFGFLLARDLKPRLGALSESFLQRFFRADRDFIRDLATSLGPPGV
jgi:hypothetical protein